MRRSLFWGVLIFLSYLPVLAQQVEINRYTLFTGFDYMISPARKLTERGFESDFGVGVKPWLSLGGDFSAIGSQVLSGAGTINGSETVFAPILIANQIPPSMVHVPFQSTSYTFAVGPQVYLRKWQRVTLFARPGFGGIHEVANINLTQVIPVLEELGIPVPNSHQADTKLFFGLGGGIDLNVSRRIGLRFATDWVNTHLFTNLLTDRQNYVRFSAGPTFRWGRLQ
ncbi:MAG: hypothetical protein WAM89_10075 [Terriglobales bacterium]